MKLSELRALTKHLPDHVDVCVLLIDIPRETTDGPLNIHGATMVSRLAPDTSAYEIETIQLEVSL